MYNIKILENACTAAIELADNCTDCDAKTQGYIYHLVKFVRAEIRDFPEKTDKLNEAFELLDKYANRLKKSAGDRLSKFIIAGDHGEKITLPINNIQGSLIHLIRQNLKEKNACNYLQIHKIADLYAHRFFEYWKTIDDDSDSPDWFVIDHMLYAFSMELVHHICWLENALRFQEISYDDIIPDK